MADPASSSAPQPKGATGVMVLADGTVIWGKGFGVAGSAVGEVCFNTAMTGYEEVMTDPSYAGQIVTFTFPHIGNVGANEEDVESHDCDSALGCVVREDVTAPSSFRSKENFGQWLAERGKIGLSGIDTRALTRRIRLKGAPNAAIAHDLKGKFDIPKLLKQAREWPGLEGMDLAKQVSRHQQQDWHGGVWKLGFGYGADEAGERPHVVAVDYGAKDNIFRNLVKAGAKVTVVPAETSLDSILMMKPAGVFLSNGPGDPAATGAYAVPVIQGLIERDIPLFGICLGHQMLGLAAGAKTSKMHQGHRGANHPVKRLADGVVEITSMNHGFAVDNSSLPENVEETHVSLFDGSNCGIAIKGKQAFGVQYHPEASPGPQDSFYLFEKFVGMLQPTPQLIGKPSVALQKAFNAAAHEGTLLNKRIEVVFLFSAQRAGAATVAKEFEADGFRAEALPNNEVSVFVTASQFDAVWAGATGRLLDSAMRRAGAGLLNVDITGWHA